jgi:hypothetical protein
MLAGFCFTAHAGLDYTVRQIPTNEGHLEITLHLPREQGDADRKLVARGASAELQEQFMPPRCGDVRLEKDELGYW